MTTIRLFRERDVGAVLELANAYASFDGTTTEADLAITSSFPDGSWVAEDDGKVVGFALGYFKEVPEGVLERWRAKKVGHVELMAVAPSYRRRGIGGLLLSRLIRELERAGADIITLDCPAEAAQAKALYEKMGFVPRFYGMKRRSVAIT
jgi:ribosomal protein S18 acetylase RimI-like enzyme